MKKILSIFIIFCLLLSYSCSSFAYSGEEAMQILKAMDTLQGDPDGNLRPDDMVKRSEFAKLAVLLSPYKLKLSLNSMVSVFIDCPSAHWAAPYVKTAAENGIIQGKSNGYFAPDDYITYAEAVTIALRLLGYTDEDFGYTYPEPQLGMAASLKLNAGVNKNSGENLSRAEVSVIFVNMLTTNKKDSSSEYIESIDYSLVDDTVIIATNDENASVEPGKLYTSTGLYFINEDFNKDLIGKKGSAVINKDGYLLTLLELDADVYEYAVYTSGNEFVSVVGKNGIESLDCDGATICYDGIEKTSFSQLRQKLTTGDSLLVSKDKSENIDYIIATSGELEGPFTANEDASLPGGDDYSDYKVLRNGISGKIQDIKKYDIAYVSKPLMTIFAYSKKISGIYQKAAPSIYSPESIIVSGNEYKIESAKAFSKLSGDKFSIGDTLVLLIGRDGGIADVLNEDMSIDEADNRLEMVENTSLISDDAALLLALGAISENYNETTMLTRAEFSKMAVMSSKHRNKVSLGTKLSVFIDCPSTHWASPYIKLAAENGILTAYSDSKFYPDKEISFAEAVFACLKILGYEDSDFADYPQSQLSLAKTKGILNGLEKKADDTLTKKEGVLLLYNTLCTTCKNSNTKAIVNLGYEYYEDAVLIAVNSVNSSVPQGKLLTSVGTFAIDDFDKSSLGKAGSVLVYQNKLQLFNESSKYIAKATVYSSVPGGIALMDEEDRYTVSVSADTPVYINASKSVFSASGSQISTGDTACFAYDEAGRLKYIYVDSSELEGPYTVIEPDAWYIQIAGADKSSKIMKNGSLVIANQLSRGDIVYYSSALDTAFVYSDRIIGILKSASPTIDAPQSINLSGVSYSIESATAFPDSVSYGDTMVICLGRNGKIAHSYVVDNMSYAGYLVSTGVGSFINENGDSYTSNYASLVLSDESVIELATDADYSKWVGSVMKVNFTAGKAKLISVAPTQDIYGTVSVSDMKIGKFNIADDVKILDIAKNETQSASAYKSIYTQRLDGTYISANDVVYSRTENGYVTELILNDVTGDSYSYGVITAANTNIGGSMSASGSYTCAVGSASYSYSGGAYTNIKKGSVVKALISGGRAQSFLKLSSKQKTITAIDYTTLTLAGGEKLKLSDSLVIYKISSSYDYNVLPLSELIDNLSAYSNFSVYSDKEESKGGRVRVITVK